MKNVLKILMLENNINDVAIIQHLLLKEKLNCEFSLTIDKETYLTALDKFYPDIILSAHSLPQFNSVDALAIARQRFPEIPFIMVTGTVSEEFAADIIKSGADDYILKDRMAKLPTAIISAIQRRKSEKEKQETAEKLLASEVRYRRLFEAAKDGILILSADTGVIEDVNPFLIDMLGYSHSEFLGKQLWEIGLFKDIVENKSAFETLKKKRYIRYENLPFQTKDGRAIWVEFVSNAYDASGKQVIQCNIRNITERKKTEKAIIESEEKYRTLVDQAFDSIIIYTPDFIIQDCNHKACSTLGYTREELKEHSVTGLFFKEDIIARPLHFETLKAGQRTLDYRRVKKKDGTEIEMEIGTKMMPDGNLMAIARDITERKKAEQKIIRSETNLRTIFENTSEGFLLMDKNAVVIAFNSKATAYTFFSDVKEFQIGQSIYDFIKESRKEFFQEIIAKVLNGESIQYDRSYEMENGTTAWIDFSATPVIETGQVNGICVTGRNITEKKLMEKKILDQYVQEQKKIARAIIKAQEKERNHIGQELHDNINQILAVIKLHLDAAGKDEKLKELIKYPIELLDSTIQEIRLLSSKLVAPLKNINLKELIRLLLADLHKNTVLKTSFVYNLSGLNISDDLKLNIYRTIQEQLNNIVKHAAAKKASVSVKADKGIINIVVADDGKGFDVNKKRKGIGISNMMNRIESFNGEMAIESSPGKGCRIVIKAPY